MVANRTHHGDGSHLVLHALGMNQPAITVLMAAQRPAGTFPGYDLLWTPDGAGNVPVFKGQLAIVAGADDDSFWLVVSGDFDRPGGVAGQRFDRVAGNTIAVTTARNLLATIRDAIQSSAAGEDWVKTITSP